MKDSHKAIEAALRALIDLTQVVAELAPGHVADIAKIDATLKMAREHMVQAIHFEK